MIKACDSVYVAYRRVSRDGVVIRLVLSGLSSGVWSELARVFIEFSVSDMDIKTLSKTELGSESSVSWRCLHAAPSVASPAYSSSSLKRPIFSSGDHIILSNCSFINSFFFFAICCACRYADATQEAAPTSLRQHAA